MNQINFDQLDILETNKQYRLKEIYKIAIDNNLLPKNIEYKDFYYIVRDFNKSVSNKIINDHYKFAFGLGLIEVLRTNRKGKSIDWHTSKQLKQALIDSGKTPFNKETAPEGEKWFVYFEGKDYFKWHWFKDKGCDFVKNVKYYVFKPMADNIKKVGKAVKENPFADLDYGIHK